MRLLAAVAVLLAASVAWAEDLSQADALGWLQRIANAARQLNYGGTFVYHHGDAVESSQLVHMTDGHGEWEKLTTNDGRRCEVVRVNELLSIYLPDLKLIRIEHRSARRAYPALPPEQLGAITDFYDLRKTEVERVAGYDAQALELEPKDGYRYGHKIWADTANGLLVKARMTNDKHQVLEQFVFTQLTINRPFNLELVKPSYSSGNPDWKTVRSWSDETPGTDLGWVVKTPPPGFRKVMEMRRSKEGDPSVTRIHLVLSDGLAAVSVFIEPIVQGSGASDGATQHGVINVFSRTLGDQRITALGETPPITVMQIANATVPKTK